MIHEMRLHNEPFTKIKLGKKTIELRLNDEKRKLIKIGDIINFTNRKTNEDLKTRVVNLYYYNNFEELFKNFNKISLGYDENEVANSSDLELYYSKDEQLKYGVVGIEIKLI